MSNISKNCKKCFKVLYLKDFPKCKTSKDGHRGNCYECERLRLGIRQKKRSKEYKRQVSRRYKNKYPEKRRAVSSLHKVQKKKGYHFHHWSYNDEHFRDFIELTVSDHKIIHRHIIYDQPTKMYKRSDTMRILCSKKEHFEYIQQFI